MYPTQPDTIRPSWLPHAHMCLAALSFSLRHIMLFEEEKTFQPDDNLCKESLSVFLNLSPAFYDSPLYFLHVMPNMCPFCAVFEIGWKIRGKYPRLIYVGAFFCRNFKAPVSCRLPSKYCKLSKIG